MQISCRTSVWPPRAAIFVGALNCFFAVVYADGNSSECVDVTVFSAEEYWFWHAYSGVRDIKDRNGVRVGRRLSGAGDCFEVSVSSLDAEKDRTRGYRRAFEELLNAIPAELENWSDEPEVILARNRVEKLTGLRFEAPIDVGNWWQENRDFIAWSSKTQTLTVDIEAERLGKPVLEDSVEASAAEYWSLWGQDRLEDVTVKGAYLYATAWIPPEGQERIRVQQKNLQDQDQKLQGLLHALSVLMFDGLMLTEIKGRDLEQIMAQLRLVTSQAFNTREEWISWYQKNSHLLLLSEDGEHLVVAVETNG